MSINLSKVLKLAQPNVYRIHCPGCKHSHLIPVQGADIANINVTARWSFNGDVNLPTFTPSVHCKATTDWNEDGVVFTKTLCHFFVTNGQLQFLGDCDHELAGKTVPMFEFLD